MSRSVLRQAPCSVLVVRGATRAPRRFLIGVDGSAHARAAVAFVAGLTVPRGGQARLLSVVEPVRPPSTGLPGRIRALVAREATSLERERAAVARRQLEAARERLARAGWRVKVEVQVGRPLEELLRAATDVDVLVVGARGVGTVERMVAGSVAEGAVSRAPVPVLIVR